MEKRPDDCQNSLRIKIELCLLSSIFFFVGEKAISYYIPLHIDNRSRQSCRRGHPLQSTGTENFFQVNTNTCSPYPNVCYFTGEAPAANPREPMLETSIRILRSRRSLDGYNLRSSHFGGKASSTSACVGRAFPPAGVGADSSTCTLE